MSNVCRLNIALELAKHNSVYEDIASKFFEVCLPPFMNVTHILMHPLQHFIFIADAMTYKEGDNEVSLWNEQDGMYYDAIEFGPGNSMQLPVRSLVGLIPLYGTLVLEPSVLNRFPGFKKRVEWFLDNRPEVSARNMANMKGVYHVYHPPLVGALIHYCEIQSAERNNGGFWHWLAKKGL